VPSAVKEGSERSGNGGGQQQDERWLSTKRELASKKPLARNTGVSRSPMVGRIGIEPMT